MCLRAPRGPSNLTPHTRKRHAHFREDHFPPLLSLPATKRLRSGSLVGFSVLQAIFPCNHFFTPRYVYETHPCWHTCASCWWTFEHLAVEGKQWTLLCMEQGQGAGTQSFSRACVSLKESCQLPLHLCNSARSHKLCTPVWILSNNPRWVTV